MKDFSPTKRTIFKIIGVLLCMALGTIFGATFLSLLNSLELLPATTNDGLANALTYLFSGAAIGFVMSLIVSLIALKKNRLLLTLIIVGILALLSVGTVVLLTTVFHIIRW
ncbi:MAG: hypothetical protein ACD_62C00083G0010 [uncultured bacterium]|nr:MAG: hypothetical protein ACD_62C00083G0010 [uncultured bacterium]